ncbi:hypothetical protein N0V93_001579 [Gnomoniopsis smithogilvyi]|uniref:Extracellular serine-rich protein n=1 Tax=Gnomoniopsis smithogilvyi TaxID=1191159 RepID=A0A9W9D2C3_9PEZI|nr:hypothetical protein N0V93_001579 [Gnomoniopsis smithogilvyi]
MRRALSLLYAALTVVPRVEGAFAVTINPVQRPTTTNTTRLIPILVGGSALTFTPNSVVAQPGDVLQFQFGARNHTVTQSSQQSPCQPLASGGVNSGFIPFDGGASGAVGTFDVPVMNDQPMWLYCAQATHCQSGMVMAVNAPSSSDLIAYAALASRQVQNIPAKGVQGGVAASIPLANAVVPKANASSGQPVMTNRPAGTASATIPIITTGGGTATVFTTVVVGPSGVSAGNSTGRSTGRPAQATGAGIAAGVQNGDLANAGSPTGVPFTGGGHRLGHEGELIGAVLNAVAVALGTLMMIARP